MTARTRTFVPAAQRPTELADETCDWATAQAAEIISDAWDYAHGRQTYVQVRSAVAQRLRMIRARGEAAVRRS